MDYKLFLFFYFYKRDNVIKRMRKKSSVWVVDRWVCFWTKAPLTQVQLRGRDKWQAFTIMLLTRNVFAKFWGFTESWTPKFAFLCDRNRLISYKFKFAQFYNHVKVLHSLLQFYDLQLNQRENKSLQVITKISHTLTKLAIKKSILFNSRKWVIYSFLIGTQTRNI